MLFVGPSYGGPSFYPKQTILSGEKGRYNNERKGMRIWKTGT